MPITPDNQHLLKSEYEARTARELPVLGRWFPRELVVQPEAKYLDVILYSHDQIVKENQETGAPLPSYSSPWGIISVKPQLEDYETPMAPITMMRNALPKQEGGSGVALSHEKYSQSVAFWTKNAVIKK